MAFYFLGLVCIPLIINNCTHTLKFSRTPRSYQLQDSQRRSSKSYYFHPGHSEGCELTRKIETARGLTTLLLASLGPLWLMLQCIFPDLSKIDWSYLPPLTYHLSHLFYQLSHSLQDLPDLFLKAFPLFISRSFLFKETRL